MSGGDTLIVGNGVYVAQTIGTVGVDAYITETIQNIPAGSEGAYTIIKSENVGGATIDLSNVSGAYLNRGIWIYNTHHVQIEGFRVRGNINHEPGTSPIPVVIQASSYNKLLRLAVYDAAASGNSASISISLGAEYNLVEECWAWGTGRYKFIVWQSNNNILRRCVARHDYAMTQTGLNCADIGGTSGYACQESGIVNYDSTNTQIQNCIVIDSGATAATTERIYGAFWDESNNAAVSKTGKIIGSIALNIRNNTAGIMDKASGTRTLENNIIWDSGGGYYGMGTSASAATYPPYTNLSNMTIGSINASYTLANDYAMAGKGIRNSPAAGPYPAVNGSVINSIIYGSNVSGISGITASSYNSLYNNAANFVAPASTGTGDITNTNPLTNCLKYLPRIEPDCFLKTAGSGGGQIGAQVMYKHGVSGTLYGEAGYDTLTNEPLWPFPNEALIKSDMASYSGPGPSGVRGFTAGTSIDGSPQTLTKYIWEYLGNQIPPEIYGTQTDISSPTVTSFALPPTAETLNVIISTFAATDNTGVTGYLLTETAGTPAMGNPSWNGSVPANYTFSSEGTKTLYAWAKDAAGNISASSSSVVTITLPAGTPPPPADTTPPVTNDNALAYPVPFVGNKDTQITFTSIVPGSTLDIYTLDGQLVKSQEVSDTSYNFTPNELASGTYLYVIKGSQGMKRGRFIVIK